MAGTLAGGKLAAATNRRLHGEDFYQRIAAIGGKSRHPGKGFGKSSEWARECGKKGGRTSKRPKGGV